MKIDAFLKVLNEAVAADADAIDRLIDSRVPCNDALAQHPTIQCGLFMQGPFFQVGALGLINGIAESITGERVVAVFDSDESGTRRKLVRFVAEKASRGLYA